MEKIDEIRSSDDKGSSLTAQSPSREYLSGTDCQPAALEMGPMIPMKGSLPPHAISRSIQPGVTTVSLFNRIAYSACLAASPRLAALVYPLGCELSSKTALNFCPADDLPQETS